MPIFRREPNRGRPRESRLSDEHADELRVWILAVIERRQDVRNCILQKMPGSDRRAHLGERSERWLQRACSDLEELPRSTAIEILLRLRRCGVRIPEHLAASIQRTEPPALVFPHAGTELADRIIELVQNSERLNLGEATKRKLREYLEGFEEIAKTAPGREAVFKIRSYFGKDWRGQMTRIRHLLSATDGGKTYSTPSAIQMLEAEFIAREGGIEKRER